MLISLLCRHTSEGDKRYNEKQSRAGNREMEGRSAAFFRVSRQAALIRCCFSRLQ